MPICCEEDRSTPFCPECGNNLQYALCDLLAHIAVKATETRNMYKSRLKYVTEHPEGRSSHLDPGKLKRSETTAMKWERWHSDLRSMIERDTATATADVKQC